MKPKIMKQSWFSLRAVVPGRWFGNVLPWVRNVLEAEGLQVVSSIRKRAAQSDRAYFMQRDVSGSLRGKWNQTTEGE